MRESDEEDGQAEPQTFPGFLTQERVKDLMKQLLTALNEMHAADVWHRDIKTNNIMLDENGVLKLIDFNISKVLDQSMKPQEGAGAQSAHRHTKNVVTRNFRPPEIFFGDVNYDGAQVDTWSAGCVFAELLANDGSFFPASSDIEQLCTIFDILGTPTVEDWPEVEQLPTYLPFNPSEPKDLTQVIQQRREKVKPAGEAIDPQAVDLLGKLLALNPSKRLLPAQALQHPYFS